MNVCMCAYLPVVLYAFLTCRYADTIPETGFCQCTTLKVCIKDQDQHKC